MNQTWDSDIAHRAETWAGLLNFFYPGAFFVQSHATRKEGKLMRALEDGGWEIQSSFVNYTTGAIEQVPIKFAWLKGDSKGTGLQVDKSLPEWAGFQYGGNALKPQAETIIIARKPLPKSVTDRANALATGAGAYNFELAAESTGDNRLPGTAILTHRPECVRLGFALDADKRSYWTYNCHADCHVKAMGDKAKFFTQVDSWYEQADIIAKQLADAAPIIYSGTVGATERNLGCEHLPTTRQRVTPGNGLHNDPRFATTYHHQNNHPTLKPIKLWLDIARLLLPPERYKPRMLVPFAGVGSEMIGAVLAGWHEVVGIELNEAYIPINEARVRFLSEHKDVMNYYKEFDINHFKQSAKKPQQGAML